MKPQNGVSRRLRRGQAGHRGIRFVFWSACRTDFREMFQRFVVSGRFALGANGPNSLLLLFPSRVARVTPRFDAKARKLDSSCGSFVGCDRTEHVSRRLAGSGYRTSKPRSDELRHEPVQVRRGHGARPTRMVSKLPRQIAATANHPAVRLCRKSFQNEAEEFEGFHGRVYVFVSELSGAGEAVGVSDTSDGFFPVGPAEFITSANPFQPR